MPLDAQPVTGKVDPRRSVRLLGAATLGGFVVLVGIIVWQQERIDRFAAQSVALRRQIEAQGPKADGGKRQVAPPTGGEIRSDSPAALPEEQFRELLRLRGELGVLRRQLAEAREQASKEREQHQAWREQTTAKTRFELISASIGREVDQEKMVVTTKGSLEALASVLGVPADVSQKAAKEGLGDPGLKEYEPYFRLKAACERLCPGRLPGDVRQ